MSSSLRVGTGSCRFSTMRSPAHSRTGWRRSISMEQARLAMCHAFQLTYKTAMAPLLPYGIYTIPEVSAVGETQVSALGKGLDVVIGRASFAANARGQIIGDSHGFLKLVFTR